MPRCCHPWERSHRHCGGLYLAGRDPGKTRHDIYALVQQKSGAVVSLRAHGVDTSGKPAVDLTVIRAYQVK
jgi:hypothetical protein